MKKFAIAVLILATLCSFAAAEPKYTYGYKAPQSESCISEPKYTYGYVTPRSETCIPEPKYTYGYTPIQSESRIPDPFDFLGVEAEYVDSFEDDDGNTIDIYAYPTSGAINAALLFSDYADDAAAAGCDCLDMQGEYISLAKDDMLFILGVCADDPATAYLALDTRLTIGGI